MKFKNQYGHTLGSTKCWAIEPNHPGHVKEPSHCIRDDLSRLKINVGGLGKLLKSLPFGRQATIKTM
jgi:hypothetical protein